MGVTISMPLFGNPGHELEEGAGARSADLRELGENLKARLDRAADDLDKLTADGWGSRVAMFDLLLWHSGVSTREAAEQRLRAIGVDNEQMMIVEDVEEEEGLD
jgi:hypothetical protein